MSGPRRFAMMRQSYGLDELDGGAATGMNCVSERELNTGDRESERKRTIAGSGL